MQGRLRLTKGLRHRGVHECNNPTSQTLKTLEEMVHMWLSFRVGFYLAVKELLFMDNNKKELLIGVLKSGIAAIPHVGGALNEVLFEIRGRIAQKRLNDFTNSFIESIRNLGIDIDGQIITSEDFNDIYFSIVKRVVETNCKHKLLIFKDILTNNIQKPYQSNFRETFLDLVIKLDYIQIEILDLFKDTGRAGSMDILDGSAGGISTLTSKSYEKEIKQRIHQYEQELTTIEIEGKYEFYICDLISKSLLIDSKNIGNTYNDLGKEGLTILYITDFGKEFLGFIHSD